MLDLGVAAAIARTVSVSTLTFQISAVLFFISSVMMLKTLRAIDWRKNLGFWSYAIAHGAQYLIFMFVISANQKRSIVGALLFLLALTAAMSELPALSRTILVLRDVEGRSIAEIAEALGLGVPAVKTRVHRARLFLRKRLGHYMTTIDTTTAMAYAS